MSLRIPELNKAIGYDLTIGDWIAPYGKGINADLFFDEAHTNPQSGYILSVSFLNAGDGIQEFTVPDNKKEAAFARHMKHRLMVINKRWLKQKPQTQTEIFISAFTLF